MLFNPIEGDTVMAYIRKAVREKVIAYHEAGHATIARLHGVDITRIALKKGKGLLGQELNGNIQTRQAHWKVIQKTEDLEAVLAAIKIDAKVVLAGVAVDAKRLGVDLKAGVRIKMPGIADDVHRAKYLCDRIVENIGGDADELMAELMFETIDEVNAHWGEVEKVAAMFCKRRDEQLTEADVDLAIAA
jgi:hypothetical protein